ncbi:CPBP family intramembrane metalloprotease [Paenibacillus albiflavus]|uniref:CPBP family intramembrane metalloprotease n=1 Tax=Paenibacillus albiflavus TaxID=2545760 RepID=A0A4R4ECQ4_9BACL|nr:type II CAAX endopeptidase family protein [Paenibacillus albiflavus]TCZ77469.1 CPBP family intramembrane metalloprotease [Paenibacillus albiflavus]
MVMGAFNKEQGGIFIQNATSITDKNSENCNEINSNLSWKQLLFFLLLYVGIIIGACIIVIISFVVIKVFTGKDLLFLLNDSNFLILDAFLVLFILKKYKPILRFVTQSLDFTVLRVKKTYGIILVGYIVLWAIQFIFIDYLHLGDASNQAQQLRINGSQFQSWFAYVIMYISVGVITPIKEEILFRGLLSRFLELKYRFWVGLAVSSLVFGLLHVDFPIVGLLMGITLGLVFHFSGSLVPSIILHILWNIVGTVINNINGY